MAATSTTSAARRAPSTTSEEIPLIDALAGCCDDLLRSEVSADDAERAAALFRVLADPARVRLLSIVARAPEREACVCDLVDLVDRSQPTVSHHLKVLLEAGLLERERRGSWAYYRLRPGALETVSRVLGTAAEGC
jgi:ArsR family transcriptional regulator